MPLLSLQTLSRRLSGRFYNKKRGDGSNAPSKNGKNCRNAPVFQHVPTAVEGEHTHARNDLRTPFGKGLLPVLFKPLIVLSTQAPSISPDRRGARAERRKIA